MNIMRKEKPRNTFYSMSLLHFTQLYYANEDAYLSFQTSPSVSHFSQRGPRYPSIQPFLLLFKFSSHISDFIVLHSRISSVELFNLQYPSNS